MVLNDILAESCFTVSVLWNTAPRENDVVLLSGIVNNCEELCFCRFFDTVRSEGALLSLSSVSILATDEWSEFNPY